MLDFLHKQMRTETNVATLMHPLVKCTQAVDHNINRERERENISVQDDRQSSTHRFQWLHPHALKDEV